LSSRVSAPSWFFLPLPRADRPTVPLLTLYVVSLSPRRIEIIPAGAFEARVLAGQTRDGCAWSSLRSGRNPTTRDYFIRAQCASKRRVGGTQHVTRHVPLPSRGLVRKASRRCRSLVRFTPSTPRRRTSRVHPEAAHRRFTACSFPWLRCSVTVTMRALVSRNIGLARDHRAGPQLAVPGAGRVDHATFSSRIVAVWPRPVCRARLIAPHASSGFTVSAVVSNNWPRARAARNGAA